MNVLRVMRRAEAVSARLQKEREPSVATIEQLEIRVKSEITSQKSQIQSATISKSCCAL